MFSLSGIRPRDTRRSRSEQAREVFERMEVALQDEGMTFAHVVRTWFHLDDILAWYGEFNAVRNAFFEERNIFRGVVPASTGVGMPNEHGAALVGGVLAVKPRAADVKVLPVPSPLQCPALDYRSAFSRAVEVQIAGQRHLYISGTASIAPSGASAHRNDIDSQIRLTMDVVETLLESRNMTWADASRAIAYFKDLKDAPRFAAHCRQCHLLDLPATFAQADICRGELLFEIELDAVTARLARRC
jgi:enamine deaminase RidA (YjgF/YER057c/UK114 family)